MDDPNVGAGALVVSGREGEGVERSGCDGTLEGSVVKNRTASCTTPFTRISPDEICTTVSGGFLGMPLPFGPSSGPDELCET